MPLADPEAGQGDDTRSRWWYTSTDSRGLKQWRGQSRSPWKIFLWISILHFYSHFSNLNAHLFMRVLLGCRTTRQNYMI